MIELQHSQPEPQELTDFNRNNSHAGPDDFDSSAFVAIKPKIREALNEEQGGLCVYCERTLAANKGQIDHIKPKSGPNAHPALTFSYTNYAHSCITDGKYSTCGQKKKHGLLPIEPSVGCNTDWVLSTVDGKIEPKVYLTRKQRHPVVKTRDMLGLNANPVLVEERFEWIDKYLEALKFAVAQGNPTLADQFLQAAPFRYILKTI